MQSPVEQHPSSPYLADDEIDLLELLAVVAENIKLLILVPLAVGVLAWGATFWMTPVYQSVSILNPASSKESTPNVITSLAKSADVIAAVGKEFGTTFKDMDDNIQATAGRQDNLVTLTAQAATPLQAQQINQAILRQLYPLTQPVVADRKRMEERKKRLQNDLAAGVALAQSLAKQLESGQVADETARAYSEVSAANDQRIREIDSLQKRLEGLSDANLIQKPTLPGAPVKPKKTLIAIVAAMATGMLLFFFVLLTRQLMKPIKRRMRFFDV